MVIDNGVVIGIAIEQLKIDIAVSIATIRKISTQRDNILLKSALILHWTYQNSKRKCMAGARPGNYV